MSQDIYRLLQKQMDQYSVGFPETASGIELKILKRLFTKKDAELYLDLSMLLEEPESLASRTGRDPVETAERLASMADKGLIFRLRRGDKVRYGAVPFVVGSYEFQLKNMDRELSEMVEAFFQEAFLNNMSSKTLPMRTIPVNRSVDPTHPVASHDDAREIVKAQKKLAVAKCICRTQQGLLDNRCDKPLEVCFVFGSHADYFVENGMARFIDTEEALSILDKAEEAGLVNQPFNVTNPGGMCNCCGCCCGVLRALKLHPKPREMVLCNYYAKSDPELCTGCGLCTDRCQMDAITISDDGVAEVSLDRCIGCGLCVTTCPEDAMELIPVPESEKRLPPNGVQELMAKIAEERGTSLMPLSMQKK